MGATTAAATSAATVTATATTTGGGAATKAGAEGAATTTDPSCGKNEGRGPSGRLASGPPVLPRRGGRRDGRFARKPFARRDGVVEAVLGGRDGAAVHRVVDAQEVEGLVEVEDAAAVR